MFMKTFILALTFALIGISIAGDAKPKSIHVIVALCDNEHQGILPVNPKIGNGDDLENNLYWGCSDGMSRYFKNSNDWTLTETKKVDPAVKNPTVLETLVFKHKKTGAILTAEAWRGREIKGAIQKFTDLLNDEETDLVAYIGHNGLMEFDVLQKAPTTPRKTKKDAVVLCCKSDAYFDTMLTTAGVSPVLMTDQFMYPGSFLLKAAIDGWLLGESPTKIRDRAAAVYAKNQKIRVSAARGVFTHLKKDDQ